MIKTKLSKDGKTLWREDGTTRRMVFSFNWFGKIKELWIEERPANDFTKTVNMMLARGSMVEVE